ncbi:MAG TPA: TetR family transcriptional regulator [Pseudomonas sp.]|nr:TetR family transcriptional regulator [Pseudomonas sp.]
MGHSQASKQETHERVVELAARRFRELGLDGLSIASLMQEAGLTHGGFYKHFKSRDDLVSQALTVALDSSEGPRLGQNSANVESLITDYLSPAHMEAVGTGCAVAALLNDVARGSDEVRALFTARLQRHLSRLSTMLDTEESRADAVLSVCAMVGALGLARAVTDGSLSVEILNTVREYLVDKVSH